MRRSWTVVTVMVAVGLAGAACGGGDGDGEQTVPVTTADTTTTAPGVTTSVAGGSVMGRVPDSQVVTFGATSRPAVGVPDRLPDGAWFGYIRDIDLVRNVVVFDLAEWFVGADATREARRDGAIGPTEVVANDVYVRNASLQTRDVPISGPVVITVARCPAECASYWGELAGLAASFDDGGPHTLADPYRGAESQYWVTVRGDRLLRIDEQYLP